MTDHPAMKGPSLLVRLWRLLVTPSAHFGLGALLLYGVGLGVVLWGGFHWAIDLSNTEAFCTSCHEHAEYTLPEVRNTSHYSNVTGIQANCYDCHVPRDWLHKVTTKIYATREFFAHMNGDLASKELYEAKRQSMAENVWQNMRESDSRECRNCHSLEAMNLRQQEGVAARQHELARLRGVTCIECHMGIAHKLPPGTPERRLLTDAQ